MQTDKDIEARYNSLLKDVETKDFYKIDLTNRVNCYTCEKCGHTTKTRDVAAGVTPAFHTCEKCGQLAHSSFYQDIAPLQEPTQEWYRPTLEQLLQMKNQPGIIEHILKGGLDVRKIEKDQTPIVEKNTAPVAESHITIGDVLEDTDFQNILRKRIWGLNKYTMGQYKSNPVKTLEQKGLLRVEHFVLQFPLILAKTCKLSSQERAVIDSEVWTSIREWQINNENNKNYGNIVKQGLSGNRVVS